MESLDEIRLFLFFNKESVKNLEGLEKSCDYFKIINTRPCDAFEYGNWYGLIKGFYRVEVYVTSTKDSLYENASKLFLKLKEFENKDSLPLDG